MEGKRIKVGVYGTLKEGGRLHHLLGDNATRLGDTKVYGYMFMSYGYPHLFEFNPSSDESLKWEEHQLEIYEIDEVNYASIWLMERQAGYNVVETPTQWGEVRVFWSDPESHNPEVDKPIKSFPVNN